ncbi:hypothetical protein ACJ2A9_16125 [Anaerobacillus sp. MEB173]|uniref:hypothetical protein n=1 Tax=Anaerobacillus sp. MEB173 TaxID=3383345 RepID=UPI003F92D83C
MEGYDLIIIIMSAISAITVMPIVLLVQRKLEREVNGYRQLLLFHLINILAMMLFYGTTSLALKSVFPPYSQGGFLQIVLHSLVFPFPFLLLTYVVGAIVFRNFIRPYIIKKGTNVVYMKKAIKKEYQGEKE